MSGSLRAAFIPLGDFDVSDQGEPPVHESSDFVQIAVDLSVDGVFLFSSIGDPDALGIFVHVDETLPVGTSVSVLFSPPEDEGEATPAGFEIEGQVVWLSRGERPGIGVQFFATSVEQRSALLAVLPSVGYFN